MELIDRPSGLSYCMHEYKQFYRRKLPHLHTPGASLFVTFRLAGSVPKTLLNKHRNEKLLIDHQLDKKVEIRQTGETVDNRSEQLKEFHRSWFRKFEDVLHKEAIGPVWLKDPKIASLVFDSLVHRDGKDFDLRAFVLCLTTFTRSSSHFWQSMTWFETMTLYRMKRSTPRSQR